MRDSVLKHWMRSGLGLLAGLSLAVGCAKTEAPGRPRLHAVAHSRRRYDCPGRERHGDPHYHAHELHRRRDSESGRRAHWRHRVVQSSGPHRDQRHAHGERGSHGSARVYNLTVNGTGARATAPRAHAHRNRGAGLFAGRSRRRRSRSPRAPTAPRRHRHAHELHRRRDLESGECAHRRHGSFNPAAPRERAPPDGERGSRGSARGLQPHGQWDGAPGNRSTPLTLTVSAAPDYSLSLRIRQRSRSRRERMAPRRSPSPAPISLAR